MKKYFSYAVLLVGVTLTAVSCAPIIRVGYGTATGNSAVIESSFLGLIMLLAFASLFSIVGVLMYIRYQLSCELSNSLHNSSTESKRIVIAQAATLLLYLGIPFAHVFVPLWLWNKSQVNSEQRKQYENLLNFQITWTLFAVVAMMLCVVLVGIFLLAALIVFHWVTIIRALRATHNGQIFTYPLCLSFIPRDEPLAKPS